MINDQADRMLQDFAQRLQYQGMDIKTYMQYTGTTMEMMKEHLHGKREREHLMSNLIK